jgi:two-component system, cell cycle sensor histidine kinase and response regulator CckA
MQDARRMTVSRDECRDGDALDGGVLHSTQRALEETQARLQQILDNASSVVFAKDRDGRYLFVNREFERVVGQPAEAVIGRTDFEIFPSDVAARLRHNDLRVLNEGRSLAFEESAQLGPEGRTFLTSKFPLLDADGHAYAVCGMATDITERKRVEETLRTAAFAVSSAEDESLFRELVRYLAEILDVDGAFVATPSPSDPGQLSMRALYLNAAVRENFSYPLADSPCETVVAREFRIYPSRLTDMFPMDVLIREQRLEGYAGYPLTDSHGKPLGLISIIARRPLEHPEFIESVLKIFAVRAAAELERSQAKAALLESEASYREIFEASEDAILVHDWDTGAIADVNSAACRAYGYTHEEFMRLTPTDLSSGVPPYDATLAAAMIDRARCEGVVRFEWHRRNKDGSLHWDEVCLKSAQIGGRPRVLAFVQEVTERKDAEARRVRLEGQLRQAQKMEAIGQLTGGIAHDFNNLLTSIMGYIVLATERQSGTGDGRLAGYLQQAHRSCERARDLIQQMLMFSRGQRGAPRPVSVASLVRESLPLLRSSLPREMEIAADVDPGCPPARLDPLQLEQVLLNLCINARDALEGTGTLRIGARARSVDAAVCTSCRREVCGEYVEITVADEGPGMTREVAERIFEPFFSTKEARKGSGMGLAIVHGIVHEHGGHVLVDSAPGAGTGFHVLFPALPDAAVASAAPAGGDTPGGKPGALRGSVLVVDDEATVGEFMRELLDGWGLESASVRRPQEAIELLERNPQRYDLVITDQSMPRMTGLELACALHAIRPELPVILYTGYSDDLQERDLAHAGVRDLLNKPIDPATLAQALARHLPRAVD